MAEHDLLGKIFSAAAGVWTIACMVAVALFRAWPHILGRFNERKRDSAEEKAGDWDRLRDENKRLHTMLAECERERIEFMRRAVIAESALEGRGRARQEAATIVAIERLTDAKKREDGGGK